MYDKNMINDIRCLLKNERKLGLVLINSFMILCTKI